MVGAWHVGDSAGQYHTRLGDNSADQGDRKAGVCLQQGYQAEQIIPLDVNHAS